MRHRHIPIHHHRCDRSCVGVRDILVARHQAAHPTPDTRALESARSNMQRALARLGPILVAVGDIDDATWESARQPTVIDAAERQAQSAISLRSVVAAMVEIIRRVLAHAAPLAVGLAAESPLAVSGAPPGAERAPRPQRRAMACAASRSEAGHVGHASHHHHLPA